LGACLKTKEAGELPKIASSASSGSRFTISYALLGVAARFQ
jgi:hypothetical protein